MSDDADNVSSDPNAAPAPAADPDPSDVNAVQTPPTAAAPANDPQAADPQGDNSGDANPVMLVAAAKGDGTGADPNTVAAPCNISLKVQCGHTSSGIRQTTGDHTQSAMLQLVPSTGQVGTTVGFTCMGGKLKVSGTRQGEGTDTVTATILADSSDGAPNPQIAITTNDPPAESDWVSGLSTTRAIPAPTDEDFWQAGFQAVLWKAFARGNPDDVPVTVVLPTYPSTNFSGSVSTDFLQQLINDFNSSYKSLMSSLPIQVSPQFTAPTGTIQVASGWQEASDVRAFYGWTITLQLNPLFGVALQFSANALALAAMMVDIPPSLSQYLGKIILSFTFGGTVGVAGTFGCTGPDNNGSTCPVSVTGGISVTVAGEAVAGNGVVLAATVKLSATAGISWNGSFVRTTGGGVSLSHNLKFSGITAAISVSTTAFGIESKDAGNVGFTLWAGGQVNLPSYTLLDAAASPN